MSRHGKGEELLTGLGLSVAKRRSELGMSQEDLADKSQVHRTYISDVERGVRNVSVLTLARIALALDIPLGALFALIPSASETAGDSRRKRSSADQ